MNSPRGVRADGRYFTPPLAAENKKNGPRATIPRADYWSATTLFLGKDPLHQGRDVGIGHCRVRRHRHVAPDPLATALDLGRQLGGRVLVGAVLRGDVLVGRADHLLVHGVAGEAGVLLGQFVARHGGKRNPRHADEGNTGHHKLHAFSLRVAFKSTRSLIGSRQVTPRHSQALTGCARRGLSRSAGRFCAPSGMASTSVSGRNSRASSRRQPAMASGAPLRMSVLGWASCSSKAIAIIANPPGNSRIAGWNSWSVRSAARA